MRLNQKPKILLVADTFRPQVDGVIRFMEEFIKRSKNHFELSLLVPKFDHQHTKDVKTTFLETSKFIKPLPTYPSIKTSLKNLKKIKNAVQSAEIVFIQGPALASYFSVYYAHKYNKKIVMDIQIQLRP